jgi:hypothetical protein
MFTGNKGVDLMMQTLWAVVHDGKIELTEPVTLPEGTRVLVTVPAEEENQFWVQAEQKSLSEIWDNAEDDVYAQLLKK